MLSLRNLTLLFITLLLSGCALFAGDLHPQLKAFPQADAGMQRFVIVLPYKARDAESEFKVEIIPGKTMMTDGVNRYNLGLSIKSEPLKGWGYTYYNVSGPSLAMSTKIQVYQGLRSLSQVKVCLFLIIAACRL